MFIIFESSITDNLENQSDEFKNELLFILNKAADSLHDKNHYISTQTSNTALILSRFSEENNYSLPANAFFHIYNNFSIINSVQNNLLYYVSIGKYENPLTLDKNVIKVNYSVAKNRHFWDETTLIPEYSEDDKYFKAIMDYEKKHISKYSDIDYTYIKEQGGGHGNINQSFKNCISASKFVITILDTDKDAPDDELGSTAKDFEADNEIYRFKDYFYYIPDIHEIENLFSSNGFLKLGNYDDNTIKKINNIEMMEVPEAENFRAYFDIKEGYTVKEIVNNTYLSRLFDITKNISLCANFPCPCHDKGCCKNVLKSGTRIYLRNVFNNTSFNDEFDKNANELIPKIKKEWFNIFQYILTACCRYNRKIAGVS